MTMDPSEREDRSPKHPGERGYGHGDTVTLTVDAEEEEYLERGSPVTVTGNGTVVLDEEDPDGILKNNTYDGEEGAVHFQGVVRANDDYGTWMVLDEFSNGEVLIHLNKEPSVTEADSDFDDQDPA